MRAETRALIAAQPCPVGVGVGVRVGYTPTLDRWHGSQSAPRMMRYSAPALGSGADTRFAPDTRNSRPNSDRREPLGVERRS